VSARYARRAYLAEVRSLDPDETDKLARLEHVSVDTNVRVRTIEEKVDGTNHHTGE
jgi:hypothetical protein